MKTVVLIGHFLTPGIGDDDGGAYISTDEGTARNFGTVEAAQSWIDSFLTLDQTRIYKIILATEIPMR